MRQCSTNSSDSVVFFRSENAKTAHDKPRKRKSLMRQHRRIFEEVQAMPETSVPTTQVEASPFNLQRALRGLNVVVNDNAEQKPLPSLVLEIFQ